MREKRTAVDFSKHILTETHFKDEITGHTLDVWDLKVPNTNWYRVVFINSCGVLTVDGDYGRYSFCREFHPSAEGAVSDGYWHEKLRIGNDLEWDRYDAEETEKEIKNLIDGGLEDYGYEGEELEKLKEQFTDLLGYVDDKIAYEYHAYRDTDIDDYEMIPYVKKHNVRLDIIFDAFDEICRRLAKK
jgi:hypothetical protein